MPSTSIHTVCCREPISLSSKTVNRCDLTIKCDKADCPGNASPWTCEKCNDILEYGIDDGNVYCSCGITDSSSCDFKCLKRATIYTDPERLKKALGHLIAPVTHTILILGETGVGKSTWINAFVNYLRYPTLKDAIKSKKPITLIPNEFTYTDDKGKSIVITNGQQCGDEDFTTGQSSTQRCKVHRFKLDSGIIRIIDTPGIGDTRSAAQDDINFRDVLDTIASFDEIHAIMILLKPNQATLTMTFRYCIQELLTHLHRSAKNNIVFGFTNCRGTDFRPGDRLPSLKKHLESRARDIKCDGTNIFCFDSEGYRGLCLKMRRDRVELSKSTLKSYENSWKRSVEQVNRLRSYIGALEPHNTRTTLSLNDARRLIPQLTKPMAEATKMICINIESIQSEEERINGLNEMNASLLSSLTHTTVGLEREDLAHPRTVCTNKDCVTVGNYNGRFVTTHTRSCHDDCTLKDVASETTNNSALRECTVMVDKTICKVCSHGYEEHMHITYRYNEITVKRRDEERTEKIIKNVYERTDKLKYIRHLEKMIARYRYQLSTIEKIAAKFGDFLERYSITPYNDARIEYLQCQIDELKGLLPSNGTLSLIEQLEQSVMMYAKEVETIKKARKPGTDEDSSVHDIQAIKASLEELYSLENFGAILKERSRIASEASRRTQREVTHIIMSPGDGAQFERSEREEEEKSKLSGYVRRGLGLLGRGFDLLGFKGFIDISLGVRAEMSRSES